MTITHSLRHLLAPKLYSSTITTQRIALRHLNNKKLARGYAGGELDRLLNRTLSPKTPLRAQKDSLSTPPSPNVANQGHMIWGKVLSNLGKAKSHLPLNPVKVSPDEAWRLRSSKLQTDLSMGKAGLDGRKEEELPTVSTGRTVTITAGGSFQQAIRQLNTILGRNRVRREWNRDKFFTKPSQLRYQLRSRRHRKRFAAMVRRNVQIVQAIKRRGM